ncbi:hypothetical protein WJX74_003868 [Apatococcus lobatus]|uniref:2-(3-amino-3-carboxypropyl)histidine synthase subunit 1 n=1 Tax=Apatococcus lobatus TaxID=904363 RepID=A0AAW1RLF1_9CHLO
MAAAAAPQSCKPDGNGAQGSEQKAVVMKPPVKRFVRQQVPDEILHNIDLNEAMGALPLNYNFEIHKTVWRLKQAHAKCIALQFPEGLLMYSCILADIFERFAGVEDCYIMGDVTYGACCVDDYSASALEADFLVHYGHSCLVPVDITSVPCLYVFVDIKFDVQHLIDTIRHNFEAGSRLEVAGTIQFASCIQLVKQDLAHDFPTLHVPQSRPLSPGEVLGCTAPVLDAKTDAIVFVADGRFHLEAIMIANPTIPAYRYDPYGRVLTREEYDQEGMRSVRRKYVQQASRAQQWGLVLGTLGRQGNPRILTHLQSVLESRGLPFTTVLLSELSPPKLQQMGQMDAWVQIACPRLSIDWGEGFSKPTLTPYEALIALGEVEPWWGHQSNKISNGSEAYPMDYYARDGGIWNSSYSKKPTSRRVAALPHIS